MSSNTSNKVFEYTGGQQRVPKNVVSVKFHPSVVEVDDEAFQLCKILKEVVLNEGLEKIGRCAFRGCKSLESITIPSTVTLISNAAFQSCGELRKVVLNDGLKKIHGQAFELCKLQSITIPSTVTSIYESAFCKCSSLNQVVLNEGLVKIGMQAFIECTSLERITLPSSVKEIGSFAFYQCINLREVVCIEALPKIDANAFRRCSAFLERITFPNISSRLEAIIQAGQVDVKNKIQQCIDQSEIEWERGDTIHIPVVAMRRISRWDLVQQHFSQIINWIKYYEMKEATTIFELALWKAKIDQVVDADGDREACRIEVPGPVKDNILHYLIGRHAG